MLEELEDTKGVIRICILKKDRQPKGQKDKQRSTKHTHCILFKHFMNFLISFQFLANSVEGDGKYTITPAVLKTFGEVHCQIPQQKRKRRSTGSSRYTVYLVSVTNNGESYSDGVPYVVYDSSCRECYISDTFIVCNQRVRKKLELKKERHISMFHQKRSVHGTFL